jgi:hypothetical protein
LPHHLLHSLRIANVGMARAEPSHGISAPLAHERFAQQAGSAKNYRSHWNLVETRGGAERYAPLVFRRHDRFAVQFPVDLE